MDADFSALFVIFAVLFVIALFPFIIMTIIGRWKMFEKAGRPGWAAIIPYYNTYVEFDIAWNKSFGLIFIIASIFTSIFTSIARAGIKAESVGLLAFFGSLAGLLSLFCLILRICKESYLAKAFGQDILMILLLVFLYPIAVCILGFGQAEYIGKEEDYY